MGRMSTKAVALPPVMIRWLDRESVEREMQAQRDATERALSSLQERIAALETELASRKN